MLGWLLDSAVICDDCRWWWHQATSGVWQYPLHIQRSIVWWVSERLLGFADDDITDDTLALSCKFQEKGPSRGRRVYLQLKAPSLSLQTNPIHSSILPRAIFLTAAAKRSTRGISVTAVPLSELSVLLETRPPMHSCDQKPIN